MGKDAGEDEFASSGDEQAPAVPDVRRSPRKRARTSYAQESDGSNSDGAGDTPAAHAADADGAYVDDGADGANSPEPPTRAARKSSGAPKAKRAKKSDAVAAEVPADVDMAKWEAMSEDERMALPHELGIDEAGRGPVLGAMVYGSCYTPVALREVLRKMPFADSKQLKEEERDRGFALMKATTWVQHEQISLSPEFISTGMFRKRKYNLNAMSHDTAIQLIRNALARGYNITEVYVDTVGPPDKYQDKLQRLFPAIAITVAKKADALFPVVSAASIGAKVTRDHELRTWTFREGAHIKMGKCSGYPGDSATKAWLSANVDHVFGFPNVVRFSWGTSKKMLATEAAQVDWSDDEDDDDDGPGEQTRLSFGTGHERSRYFKQRDMHTVTAAEF